MSFITGWITNIIIFILLATIFDMLLPKSSLQKYTKMVIGLLLIAVIITPLFQLLATDLEEVLTTIVQLEDNGERNMENIVEMKKREIEESQHAYILEQMAVQLKLDANEELKTQYELEISNIEFLTSNNQRDDFPNNINKVMVVLQTTEDTSSSGGIAVVEKVDIQTESPQQANRKSKQEKEIAETLASKWGMKNKVEVRIIEGVARGDE